MKPINQTFNRQIELRQQQQQATRIAKSLIIELRISLGNHLTYFLGEPNASDNTEAISRWVLRQGDTEAISNEHYFELKEKLIQTLSQF